MKIRIAGLTVVLLVFCVIAKLALATYPPQPGWWTAPGTSITTANTSANNTGMLNLGQLRYVAVQAQTYLNNTFATAGGAGVAVNTTVTNITTGGISGNYSPANLGQLKNVAKPFYDRLMTFGYDTRANLIARGVPSTWPSPYPWNPATPVALNYAPADLGQLKLVFSFDLTSNTSGNIFTGNSTTTYSLPHNLTQLVGLSNTTDTDGDGVVDHNDYTPLDPGFSGSTLPNLGANATAHPQINLLLPNSAVFVSQTTYP